MKEAELLRTLVGADPPGDTVLAYVLGRNLDPQLLTEVTATTTDDMLESLETALSHGLISETDDGLRFTHVLVRDTLYGDLSRLRRARMHGEAATALEAGPDTDPARLAHHHIESGARLDRALHHSCRAAEQAESRFAHRTAVTLWEQALTLLDRTGGQPHRRLELATRLVRAMAISGDLARARELRLGAITQARAFGDLDLLTRVIVDSDVPSPWTTNRKYGTCEDTLVEAATFALAHVGSLDLRVRLLTAIALECDGEYDDRGPRAAREAVDLARTSQSPELLALALGGQGMNYFRTADDVRERRRIGQEMLALAEQHALGLYQVLAHMMLQQAAIGLLEVETAHRHITEGLRLAEEYEVSSLTMLGDWHHCFTHALAGRFDQAEAGYDVIAARGGMWGGETSLGWLGKVTIRLAQGRLAEMTEESRFVWQAWGQVSAAAAIHALVLAKAGSLAEARRVSASLVWPRPDYFLDLSLGLIGLLAVELADHHLAARAYEELLSWAGRFAGATSGAIVICPTDLILGDLAALLNRPEEAAGHFTRAMEVSRHADSPHWEQTAAQRMSLPR